MFVEEEGSTCMADNDGDSDEAHASRRWWRYRWKRFGDQGSPADATREHAFQLGCRRRDACLPASKNKFEHIGRRIPPELFRQTCSGRHGYPRGPDRGQIDGCLSNLHVNQARKGTKKKWTA